MAPEFLERALAGLSPEADPLARLLCGTSRNEDAAILRLPPGKALVQTVDILSPIGDNPYVFGQIAAANAMSDVYAMGGEPWCAMNIVLFPANDEGLPLEVLTEILQGGLDKMHEAGAVLAGGHTLEDPEPKYGLSVSGLVDPDCFATNSGACPGDVLVLTKPLGTGILSTTVKAKWPGWQDAEAEYCASACRLNSVGAKAIARFGLTGATDVTGFGLGGHCLEMARSSQVTIALEACAVPLMSRVLDFAGEGLIPAGSHANKRHAGRFTESLPQVNPLLELAIFDAQTSGGLLLAVPKAKLPQTLEFLEGEGEGAWVIGQVLPQRHDGILLELR